ncbi:MAG TPA: hypothetical protein VGG32_08555 [Thermoplasmata archaeon]|jgi:hypothetical protein
MSAPMICRFCGREIRQVTRDFSQGRRKRRISVYEDAETHRGECQTASGTRTLHEPIREAAS